MSEDWWGAWVYLGISGKLTPIHEALNIEASRKHCHNSKDWEVIIDAPALFVAVRTALREAPAIWIAARRNK